ncbi:hypothetical protein P43SY_007989 [Pythium insidiosum]|uniref:HECT-type E3 ubiquitin transferase n=1 Tax=Pythium insidiosum TaxID=114742 RepID=A0AAD5LNK2_PYTIN|nr:hypothetical protein P43SY_007989 [Pythium insidiosum]
MFIGDKELRSRGSARRDDRERVLEKAREQREERALQRERDTAVRRLQPLARAWLQRRAALAAATEDLDAKLNDITRLKAVLQRPRIPLPWEALFGLLRLVLFSFRAQREDVRRLDAVAQLIADTIEATQQQEQNETAILTSPERRWQLLRFVELCLQEVRADDARRVLRLTARWPSVRQHFRSSQLQFFTPRERTYFSMASLSLPEHVRRVLLHVQESNPSSSSASLAEVVLLAADASVEMDALTTAFVAQVLSVPLLFDLVGSDIKQRIADSPDLWKRILSVIQSKSLSLPHSPCLVKERFLHRLCFQLLQFDSTLLRQPLNASRPMPCHPLAPTRADHQDVDDYLKVRLNTNSLIDEVLVGTPRANKLIASIPFVVPFSERVKLFQRLVQADKAAHQGDGMPAFRVRIRRAAILEDGLSKLNVIRGDLKKKINVVFVNAAGTDEVGIDAGGLFKEFWLDLASLAFDLEYGLFLTTPGDQLLYPNPHAASSHFTRESDYLTLFQFVGRILGKALYEGIVVQPKFAHFFLSKLLHSHNHLNELPSLDPEIYKNLQFLKSYEGDVEDLGLTFTLVQDAFGAQEEIELVPNGASVPVTSQNKTRYIHLVAHYYLNTQIREQSAAFRAGLADLIDVRWLQLFNEPELQVLISGKGGDIDKITIRNDEELLPSSSTCFNTLKLPTYSNARTLRAKLLLAISSGAGFEMS